MTFSTLLESFFLSSASANTKITNFSYFIQSMGNILKNTLALQCLCIFITILQSGEALLSDVVGRPCWSGSNPLSVFSAECRVQTLFCCLQMVFYTRISYLQKVVAVVVVFSEGIIFVDI